MPLAKLKIFALGICLCFSGLTPSFAQEEYPTAVDAAKTLAPKLATDIRKQVDLDRQAKQDPNHTCQVAVFAFGNEAGKIGDLHLASSTLQGELTSRLRNETERKFVVWDVFKLKDEIQKRQGKVDPALIGMGDVKAAQVQLKALGLDAAIVGSFQTDSKTTEFAYQTFKVHANVIFVDSPIAQWACEKEIHVDPESTVWLDNNPWASGRFSVDILVDGKSLELQAVMRNFGYGKGADGTFYLDLDPTHKGKAFEIRLTNKGQPLVRWQNGGNQVDLHRLYCAAVFVDGVNSFFEESEGKYYPTQRHPRNVAKWVLAPPHHVIANNYKTGQDGAKFRIHKAAGPAESVRSVPGFQIGEKVAKQFVFANAGDSVAHEVGITKEIGLITVYFYAEKQPNDKPYYPGNAQVTGGGAGVAAGGDISNPVRTITVETYPDPVEIWRIYYRYKGESNSVEKVKEKLKPEGKDLAPITKATEMTEDFIKNLSRSSRR